MGASHHRHDISGKAWGLPEPHLPGQRGQWGGIAQDNRRFINAVFWVPRTGAPWRDLPPDYGKWGTVHQSFIRRRRKGVWEKFPEILIDDPDYEWLMAVDAHGIPVRILVTEGTGADCKEAVHLIEGISAEVLPADRGYDTNDIPAYAGLAGMQTVIPSKKNRREQREYDKYLYRLRRLAENCFPVLKRRRGIAARCAKTSDAFIAAVQVRCIAIWAAIHA